jgi:hypothetical protein
LSKITDAAIKTAQWATIMTKWRIAFETGGKKLGSHIQPSRRWQLVPFPGLNGRESAGIVDLLAIRKDHSTNHGVIKRGDFFEIILVQVKGGIAKRPTLTDIKRLRAVSSRYHAKKIVLAEWKKGSQPGFFVLSDKEPVWIAVEDPGALFR